MNQITSIPGDFCTFPTDLEITRHLWRLTEIPADLTGLLTHSKNVTTNSLQKKTFTKTLGGGHGPLATPLPTCSFLESFVGTLD